MPMTCQTTDTVDIIQLPERLLKADTRTLRRTLKKAIRQKHSRLILDLSRVQNMDVSILSVLVTTLQTARSRGGEVLLLNLTPPVRVLIELTRLQTLFHIFYDKSAAISYLLGTEQARS